jgi:hypothetical protein
LIWSKEKNVKEDLIKSYWSLFLDSRALGAEKVAQNLVRLYQEANLTERTSLEEMILFILNWDVYVK